MRTHNKVPQRESWIGSYNVVGRLYVQVIRKEDCKKFSRLKMTLKSGIHHKLCVGGDGRGVGSDRENMNK